MNCASSIISPPQQDSQLINPKVGVALGLILASIHSRLLIRRDQRLPVQEFSIDSRELKICGRSHWVKSTLNTADRVGYQKFSANQVCSMSRKPPEVRIFEKWGFDNIEVLDPGPREVSLCETHSLPSQRGET